MSHHCPHCGAKLPWVADAFCPACGYRLDEPPAPAASAGTAAAGGRSSGGGVSFRLLVMLGGVLALFSAILSLARGNWPDAMYTGGGAIALVFGGLMWGGKKSATEQYAPDNNPHLRRRYTRPILIVATCAIGVGVLAGVVRIWRGHPVAGGEDVAGVAEPGDYRNPYFGFRVRYGADWRDVTVEARARAARPSGGGTDGTPILLALARPSTAGRDDEASVVWVADPLPRSEGFDSGTEYLRRMLTQLRQRRDGPKEVKGESLATIGGLAFDRLSLARPWGDGEVRMTYWVAVERGYALVITGSYGSSEGLQAIETLLAWVSVDAER